VSVTLVPTDAWFGVIAEICGPGKSSFAEQLARTIGMIANQSRTHPVYLTPDSPAWCGSDVSGSDSVRYTLRGAPCELPTKPFEIRHA